MFSLFDLSINLVALALLFNLKLKAVNKTEWNFSRTENLSSNYLLTIMLILLKARKVLMISYTHRPLSEGISS